MVPTAKKKYRDGDLRVGIASWDDGSLSEKSIKYAYKDKSGKVSRGCPELPFDILVDMVIYSHKQGELTPEDVKKLQTQFSV